MPTLLWVFPADVLCVPHIFLFRRFGLIVVWVFVPFCTAGFSRGVDRYVKGKSAWRCLTGTPTPASACACISWVFVWMGPRRERLCLFCCNQLVLTFAPPVFVLLVVDRLRRGSGVYGSTARFFWFFFFFSLLPILRKIAVRSYFFFVLPKKILTFVPIPSKMLHLFFFPSYCKKKN